jgi:choline dehydrogenase-like flavoprotein
MPFLPAVNPNITIMMIGEKASDLLSADTSQR